MQEEAKNFSKAQRQSTIGKLNQKLKPAEQLEMMRKMKDEMNKNKANLAKDSNPNGMTKDQIKYAEIGLELETLTSNLTKETGFLTHLKKLAKQIDSEYDEKVAGKRNANRRKSMNKSPDAPSPDHRSSIGGKTALTGLKKLDTRGSI